MPDWTCTGYSFSLATLVQNRDADQRKDLVQAWPDSSNFNLGKLAALTGQGSPVRGLLYPGANNL